MLAGGLHLCFHPTSGCVWARRMTCKQVVVGGMVGWWCCWLRWCVWLAVVQRPTPQEHSTARWHLLLLFVGTALAHHCRIARSWDAEGVDNSRVAVLGLLQQHHTTTAPLRCVFRCRPLGSTHHRVKTLGVLVGGGAFWPGGACLCVCVCVSTNTVVRKYSRVCLRVCVSTNTTQLSTRLVGLPSHPRAAYVYIYPVRPLTLSGVAGLFLIWLRGRR